MFTRIAKAVAYIKAPVKTFAILHPIRALKLVGSAAIVAAAVKMIGGKSSGSGRSVAGRGAAASDPERS